MSDLKNLIRINANVEITVKSLEAVVNNAKQISGTDAKGIYRVDTADMVSDMISKFLQENDFENYAINIDNYK